VEATLSDIFEHGLVVMCLISALIAFVFHLVLQHYSNDDRSGEAFPDSVIVRVISLPMIILAWVSLALMYLTSFPVPESGQMYPFLFWGIFMTVAGTTPILIITALWNWISGGSERATIIGYRAGVALTTIWAIGSALNIGFLLLPGS
jgi:hypothetical protein